MSVRRRNAASKDQSTNETIKPGSTDGDHSQSTDEKEHHRRHHKNHHKHSGSKSWKFFTSKRFIFSLGAVVGLLAAWYSAQRQEISDLSFDQLFDDFRDMLPSSIMSEARNIEKGRPRLSESFAVGHQLRKEGYKVKHPVILIPGVISTGLESWGLTGTEECPSEKYFRKRLWGSWSMLSAMILDKNCWLKHIMLDPDTGLDPPDFKLRAAQGIEAADFFITGYWIWNKIIENLAAVGYDMNNMQVAAYDWRLSYPDLERRDGYFSKLKYTIEHYKKSTGEKVVLTSHSMGSQIAFYFLKWVEADGFGNGGKTWVNDYIESFVDISGSTLGTPKAIVALLSGEMKDTVQLNSLAVYGLEKFFSRRERADMLRSFGGIASMLPKGGDAIWGNLYGAPDDVEIVGSNTTAVLTKDMYNGNVTFGNFIRFKNPMSALSSRNLTISDAIEYLYTQSPDWFVKKSKESYSNGLAKTRKEVEENDNNPQKWINPLEVALPNAPDLKLFCFYGIGKPTERSYFYHEEADKEISHLNISISTDEPDAVVLGQGDGTISLVTHTMCHRWSDENSKFNPGGSKVTVVEMKHEPDRLDIRGGEKTAEHVDILGRTELNEFVLKIATGNHSDIENKVYSNINDWVWNIDLGE